MINTILITKLFATYKFNLLYSSGPIEKHLKSKAAQLFIALAHITNITIIKFKYSQITFFNFTLRLLMISPYFKLTIKNLLTTIHIVFHCFQIENDGGGYGGVVPPPKFERGGCTPPLCTRPCLQVIGLQSNVILKLRPI